jgi:hypothetical protein
VFGFGDMTPTFFLSPAKPHKLIWAAGPVLVLPTATSEFLGQGKLSIGPSLVALVQPGKWTVGALVNNAWSVAGPSDRSEVNQMTLQYFVNYNLKEGWYLSFAPVITANWKASTGNVWTVPVGGGLGRVFRLGLQLVNVAAQFYGNAAHPSGGSPWADAAINSISVPQRRKVGIVDVNRPVYVNYLGRTSTKRLQKQFEYFLHRHGSGEQWHHGDQTGKRQCKGCPGFKGKNSHTVNQFVIMAIVGKRGIVGSGKQRFAERISLHPFSIIKASQLTGERTVLMQALSAGPQQDRREHEQRSQEEEQH